jgi:hypothetical protein
MNPNPSKTENPFKFCSHCGGRHTSKSTCAFLVHPDHNPDAGIRFVDSATGKRYKKINHSDTPRLNSNKQLNAEQSAFVDTSPEIQNQIKQMMNVDRSKIKKVSTQLLLVILLLK